MGGSVRLEKKKYTGSPGYEEELCALSVFCFAKQKTKWVGNGPFETHRVVARGCAHKTSLDPRAEKKRGGRTR